MRKEKHKTSSFQNKKEETADNKEGSRWPTKITGQDAAEYINDMALELRCLAHSTKLNFLTYLLELVVEESALQKRRRL